MTHADPRCRCPVVSPFPEFPATASSSCGVGESIRGPEDVPIGRRGLTSVDCKWPTSQWEGETTPLAGVAHGPQDSHPDLPAPAKAVAAVLPPSSCTVAADSFNDMQPTIAELESGWLMQERVSELRSRFTNPASNSSPPVTAGLVDAIPASPALSFMRPSMNATTFRMDAATGSHVSSSSSDTA